MIAYSKYIDWIVFCVWLIPHILIAVAFAEISPLKVELTEVVRTALTFGLLGMIALAYLMVFAMLLSTTYKAVIKPASIKDFRFIVYLLLSVFSAVFYWLAFVRCVN